MRVPAMKAVIALLLKILPSEALPIILILLLFSTAHHEVRPQIM